MDWIVTTARTVEEAQTRALDLLGVDGADAEIQVIEEGKTGLFGRTKSEARVRARIKPKAPPAKDERRPSRGGDRNRSRNKGGSGKGGSNKGGGDRNRSRNKGGSNDGGSNRGGGDRNRNKDGGKKRSDKGGGDRSRSDSSRNDSSRNDRASASSGGNGGGGSKDRNTRERSSNRSRNNRDRNNRSGGRNNEDRVEMPIDEQRETLREFVNGVAVAFDADAKVELVEEGTTLQAQVTGSDLGRLVGSKASTLQSLEELSRTAMHRAAAGRRYHRIQVDVDNYRGRRRAALAEFATDLAEKVAETGESKAMEPMGAADRKLIHDAVGEVAGVETYSEGRDPRRYIVISPTDSADEEE